MKLANPFTAALAVLAALVLAYCAHEQHRARLAIESMANAQAAQRIVSHVIVYGVDTEVYTTVEAGQTYEEVRLAHEAFLKALE